MTQSRGRKCSTLAISSERLQTGGPLVGAGLGANDLHHETALAFHCSLNRRFTASHCFQGIGQAGVMFRSALGIAELNGAGLEIDLALNDFSQALSGAGKYGMTKGIEAGFIGADFFTGSVLQTFAYDDDAVFMGGNRFLDLGEKYRFVQGNFRQQNNVGSIRFRNSLASTVPAAIQPAARPP